MMTANQIQLLQLARRGASLDEPEWRLLLRNAGQLRGDRPSSKDLSNAGFDAVMATCEEMGFRDQRGPRYWRDRIYSRAGLCTNQTVHVLRDLAAKQFRYPLPSLCRQFTGGRTDDPYQLAPGEARAIIEMLKDVGRRECGREPRMTTGNLFDPQRAGEERKLHADPDQTHTGDAPAAQPIGQ